MVRAHSASLFAAIAFALATTVHAEEKPIKAFILAGQSNMRGWGDSAKLPDDLRIGNDRVSMFEDGKWQQGGRDMTQEDTAKEYLDNLKSLVAAVRKDTGASDLQFLYGSPRTGGWGTWIWINESADRFAAAAPCGFPADETGDVGRLADLPIWGMAGGADGERTTGIKKMVERLRVAGNMNVRHSEFAGSNHSEANAAVFSSVELVDWMLRFSSGE